MKNDKKIEELKAQIALKRSELGNEKFTPITNCVLIRGSTNVNINTLGEQELKLLLIEFNVLKTNARTLKIELSFGKFTVQEWFKDIQSKLKSVSHKEKLKGLRVVETKLNSLLSDGKQTELAIDELSNLI